MNGPANGIEDASCTVFNRVGLLARMSYRGKGTAHISAMFMINLRLLANRFNFEVEVAFLATPLTADVVLSYRGLLF